MTPTREAALRHLLGLYPADPCGYAADVLGASLTPQQEEVARCLLAPPYRVLVPSANKVGKTFAAGWLLNWFHDSFDPGLVLATSTTYRQVKNQLFKEVRRLRPVGLDLLPRAAEIRHRADHLALGFATNKADAFQGNHEGALLIFMDEATSVPAEFAERTETMFSGVPGHGWVAFYNPNDPTTWPYAAEQGGGWHVVRLSALDHPNVAAELRGGPPPFPAAVRLHRIRDRVERECADCGAEPADDSCFEFPPESGRWWKPVKPVFEPQVLGRWPSVAQQGVWSEQDWRRACEARPVDPDWPVQIGCDCARFGDDSTAVAVRKGAHLVHLEEHAASSWPDRRISFHTAERLRWLCHAYAHPGQREKEIPVLVDDTGGYGSGVVDYPQGYDFVGVSSSEQARDPAKYPNRRSELWFTAKLAADGGGFNVSQLRVGRHLLDKLKLDMLAVRYSLDQKNRRVVEGKKQLKARLGRSPDLPDGVDLAWYPVAAA